MNDLISRQDAVSRIADLLMLELQGKRIPTWDEVHNAMQDLPSAQQWIPCSERLPERTSEKQKRGWYLTTNGYGSVGVTKYEFEANSFGYIGWGEGHRQADIKIIAWMPLPKPWKEEKEEGEPIPHWRGQMDGCLPFQEEVDDAEIH